MTDVVSPEVRSRMMTGIRGKNTRPELLIRTHLHGRGFRYRVHDTRLPGKPDIFLPRYRAVILIHGCFWHGHGCHLFKWPSSNEIFWREKITKNIAVDELAVTLLQDQHLRTLTIWECALKGKQRWPIELLIDEIVYWLKNGNTTYEIKGVTCNSRS
jgi:DNA mismatch endonuclease (patch repair protein)